MTRTDDEHENRDSTGGMPASRRRLASTLVPDPIRRRYAAKFAVSILAVVLVIAAIGVVGYVQAGDTVERDTRNTLNSSATMQADALGEWAEGMRVQTLSVARSESIANADGSELNSRLVTTRQRLSADVRAVHYVDLESETVVASTHNPIVGSKLDAVAEPWAEASTVRNGGSGDVRTSSAYRTPNLDDKVMAFVAPVPGKDAVVVLVGTIEYRVSTLHHPTVGHSTIILDANGDVVLGDERGAVKAFGDQREREVLAAVDEAGDVRQERRDGRVLAYAPVEGTDWIAVTAVSTEQAFAVRDEVGRYVATIVLVSLVALGAVALVLGRQTVSPLARLRERAERMEAGDLDVTLASRREDEIGQLFAAFANMRDALRAQIREAGRAREEAERARAETQRMNEHLELKADEYRSVMDHAANGDLTARMDSESDSEAMTEIAVAFNKMLAEIEATTERVKRFAEEVATASEQVTASSEEVQSASEQVTESIQEISDGADRQNDSLQTVVGEMDALSTTTEEIAASSNEVADFAERTAETGRDGRRAAKLAIEGMNSIETENEETVAQIERLQEDVAQIDDLLEFITDVADQTNMLALNANIEASRSIEADDSGFGAVATEVKELAAETKDAAADIETRLERIKTQTDTAVDEVRGTAAEISDHTDSVRDAADALEEIAGYAAETNTGVQEISAATQQQAASTQQVVAMVDGAAAISEETSEEAETVAAAAEEQTTALTEVSHSASDLATQASHLSTALDRFDTAADVDGSIERDGEPALGETVPATDSSREGAAETARVGDRSDDRPGSGDAPSADDSDAGSASSDDDNRRGDVFTFGRPADGRDGADGESPSE
ncbi:methyl-accepting chemotaxis protein [Halosolutus gelatinilyticus]|uniref:methyl-accepting chemotaxis protein n=1 Tax=Halosolutus gelatinilyticus TaxID=2931975 RepID=UPI001FF4DD66|nr:methyl-accepting chemotaxis protein [Halosolutus gelatinilyticus]